MSTTPMRVEQFPMSAVSADDWVPWTPEDAQGSLPARFERVVHARPEATAVKSGEHLVSYGELNVAANRIAHALLARLGETNVPVASLLSDRVRVIQALVGVFKAAKIHTPLLPDQPAPRLLQILDDAGSPLLLVDAPHRALAAQLGLPAERLLDLDALDPDLPLHDPCLAISPEDFACLIYTSGSTGRPKGVVQKNGVLMDGMFRSSVYGSLRFGVRVPLMASPGYVAGVGNILLPLLNGATICPFALEEEGLANLRDFLLREQVVHFASTSSTFRHFMATLRPEDRFPDIKFVILFGEAVLRRDFELFKRHFPQDALLVTGLGSTEAGSLSSLILNQQSIVTERIVPAGYPVTLDKEVYVVDEAGRRVPPGVVGEIVVKSSNLGTDYWRNPELNARAFELDPEGGAPHGSPAVSAQDGAASAEAGSIPASQPHPAVEPFGEAAGPLERERSGKRIFHTGDMGLLRADGMLEHHGRKDFQVKIRGNRIELGEIEMALFDLGNVREAVVVVRPGVDGETQLIAYVVPEKPPALSAGVLRRRLAESLPAYMVPAAFVTLAALPLTASGKIDRAQLPAPDFARVDGGAARDALEVQLTHIWEELLHVPDVGIHEDFFDLGGNSLLAMRLFADIEVTLGRNLPLSFLFQASTIAELAALIRAEEKSGPSAACLVPIQAGGGRRPFFLAAGGTGGDGELVICARLARYLGVEQPFYGLRTRAVAPGRGGNDEIEAIAKGHVAEIRAVQPSGPYLLGGECIGGIVAVEMARQLRASGQGVALLCLLDTVRPTWRMRLRARVAWLAYLWQRTGGRAIRAVRNPSRIPAVLGRPRQAPPDLGYAQATMRYRPGRSGERITLLVNEEYHRDDPTLGWQGLASGGIEVHALPGTHETYIRQNVQATGECLHDCLERAHARV